MSIVPILHPIIMRNTKPYTDFVWTRRWRKVRLVLLLPTASRKKKKKNRRTNEKQKPRVFFPSIVTILSCLERILFETALNQLNYFQHVPTSFPNIHFLRRQSTTPELSTETPCTCYLIVVNSHGPPRSGYRGGARGWKKIFKDNNSSLHECCT